MSLADSQARLNVVLRDIIAMYEANGVGGRSIDILTDKLNKNLCIEFLALAESYGESMAFIDHDFLVSKLKDGWGFLITGYDIEKKSILKKLKALREDKKAEPANMAKQEGLLSDVEHKKSIGMCELLRVRYMTTISIKEFNKDPNIDYVSIHKENEIVRKANQVINRQLGKT